jgi:glutaminyl-peptide cyclotransferase
MSQSGPFPHLGASRSRWLWGCVVLIVVAAAGLTAAGPLSPFRRQAGDVQGVEVVQSYPHDPAAFTQGLIWSNGALYEGTGQYGKSSLRRVDLQTGKVEQAVPVDPKIFGEGITELGERIYQLTWENHFGLIYDRKSFQIVDSFRYAGEGWGLTTDGEQLIMSDGSSVLRFLNPKTFAVTRRVTVRGPGGAVDKLNELEFVNGEVYANIWYSDRIARINPRDGRLLGWIDCSHVYPANRRGREEVLNGIAWDPEQERLFVTGKNWPKLYEIKVVPPQ